MNDNESSSKITKNVVLLGFVSFFADIATEMVYPLMPKYLFLAFGATPGIIGIIEGIAESIASILKTASGAIADKFDKKKTLAFAGYSSALL